MQKINKNIMVMLRSGLVREQAVPDWIVQGARLTGLLMDVFAQEC